MSTIERVAQIEQELAEAKAQLNLAYVMESDFEEEYYIRSRHTRILCPDGDTLAGIIVDEDVMKKYFKDLEA